MQYFSAEQFIASLYLVGYPFAIGEYWRVGEHSNRRNFNGYDGLGGIVSGPTGLARRSHGALALQMIEVRGLPELLTRCWDEWRDSGRWLTRVRRCVGLSGAAGPAGNRGQTGGGKGKRWAVNAARRWGVERLELRMRHRAGGGRFRAGWGGGGK
jgi:hypothetical protein